MHRLFDLKFTISAQSVGVKLWKKFSRKIYSKKSLKNVLGILIPFLRGLYGRSFAYNDYLLSVWIISKSWMLWLNRQSLFHKRNLDFIKQDSQNYCESPMWKSFTTKNEKFDKISCFQLNIFQLLVFTTVNILNETPDLKW